MLRFAQKLTNPLKYKHVAQVTNEKGYRFPLDMLRYDSCYPLNEAEVGRINDEGQSMYVVKYTEGPSCNWSEGRWASYGYSIAPVDANNLRPR